MSDPVVGQRVVIRDAFGDLYPATVVPVPREWRAKRGTYAGSDAITDLGGSRLRRGFPKCWVRIRRDGKDGVLTPWPLADVLTELPG